MPEITLPMTVGLTIIGSVCSAAATVAVLKNEIKWIKETQQYLKESVREAHKRINELQVQVK